MRAFVIGDIVVQKKHERILLIVTGYIHDDKRLFVYDPSEQLFDGAEFEISFGEVVEQYRKL